MKEQLYSRQSAVVQSAVGSPIMWSSSEAKNENPKKKINWNVPDPLFYLHERPSPILRLSQF